MAIEKATVRVMEFATSLLSPSISQLFMVLFRGHLNLLIYCCSVELKYMMIYGSEHVKVDDYCTSIITTIHAVLSRLVQSYGSIGGLDKVALLTIEQINLHKDDAAIELIKVLAELGSFTATHSGTYLII